MKKESCLKIQWGKLHTLNGKPVCPDCHEEAEHVLGFMCNPCWAHKLKEIK